jgi:hypothetical protein
MRTELTIAVHHRALLGIGGKGASFSVGELVNLQSSDSERAANIVQSLHQLHSLPLQIVAGLYLLYVQLGWASMAGVALVILLIPVNRFLAVRIGSVSCQPGGFFCFFFLLVCSSTGNGDIEQFNPAPKPSFQLPTDQRKSNEVEGRKNSGKFLSYKQKLHRGSASALNADDDFPLLPSIL